MINEKKSVSATRVFFENLIVAGLIAFSAYGLHAVLVSSHTIVSTIWPAGGIALAGALRFGWRVAPGIVVPIAAGSIGAAHPLLFGFLAPVGFAVSVYIGRWLCQWKKIDVNLTTARDVLILAGLGVVLPMWLAGSLIASAMMITGMIAKANFLPVAWSYFLMNATGSIIIAPVALLVTGGHFRLRVLGFTSTVVGVFQLALILGTSWVAFFGKIGGGASGQALAYLPFPFVVWVALSRGLGGSALAVLFSVAMALCATSLGRGPFITEKGHASILQIEVFIAIITTSGLLIGAGSDAQRREKALQSVAATRKAELERLKAQVNPHFLFNCLTAIHSLVRTDSRAAEAGLTSLSSLLRKSLDVAKQPLIPLGEELEIIRDALRLQKMRYEEGLEWSVAADDEAEKFRVPPMLLQPLVENAVKHGVSDGFGRVDVTAVVDRGDLLVKVRNTAPDGCVPANWSESVGLASVRARIEEACPTGSKVEFTKTPDGWIQALVRIKPVVGGAL
jgi:integral membrane sensor domain MASE1